MVIRAAETFRGWRRNSTECNVMRRVARPEGMFSRDSHGLRQINAVWAQHEKMNPWP